MHAAQGLEVLVVEALHADRETGDAGTTEGTEAVALEGAGVGLQGDLAAGRQGQAGAEVAEQTVDGFG